MADRARISGRQLRHGSPEESLSPGESVIITKRSGKTFELTRTDRGQRNINDEVDRVLREIPAEGPRPVTDLARVIVEDRE